MTNQEGRRPIHTYIPGFSGGKLDFIKRYGFYSISESVQRGFDMLYDEVHAKVHREFLARHEPCPGCGQAPGEAEE